MADEETIASCIRGYHIYKTVWKARIGEVLSCAREPTNAIDRYAVSVFKYDTVVGHLPQKISRVCSSFIRRGGEIMCEVTGRRRHSRDLVQGGLELPCTLIMKCNKKELDKVKQLLK